MEFEFGIVGDDLALSDDENLSSQLSIQALEMELQRQHELNFAAWDGDTAGQFQGFLDDLVCELQPGKDDYLVRLDTFTRLSSALDYMDSFRGATLSTFGSFESNFYTRWADLDLSLELPNRSTLPEPISKKLKVKILKSLLRILIKRAEARNVQFIPYARVPLITFEDSHHNISCDISVNNGVAILKSRFLRWVGEIDSRCRDLIFLVKCWAKAHCINDPKMGMLNSFALCLLVVFHLQTRSPPVLPPLNAVLDEDIARQLSDPQNSTEDVLRGCWEKIQPFIIKKFGVQNKSSVAELFITFFNQFSAVTELWSEGLAVCTFTGTWGDRTSTCGKWRSKSYVMAIEDPFDRTENCARSVQGSTFRIISGAFASTADMLCRPDCGLSWLLEALFHWPMGTQNLGLRAWLSKVYSKEGKLKTIQVKKNTMEQSTAVISVSRRMHKAAQEVEHRPHNNRVLPLDAFVENSFEVQSREQLQFNLAVNAAEPKRTRRTKKKLLVPNEVEKSLPSAALEDVGVAGHDLVSELDAQKGLHPEVQGIDRKQKSRALKKGSQKNSLAILEGISETSPLVMKSDIKVQPWENPLPNADGPTENHTGVLSIENPVVNVEVQSGEWLQFNHAVNMAVPKKTRRTKKKLLVSNEVENSLPSAALENVGVAGHDLVSELDAQKGLHPEVQGIARKQKSRALKKGSQKNSLAILEGISETSPLEMLVVKSDIKVQPWGNPLANAEGPIENHIGALSLENPVVNMEQTEIVINSVHSQSNDEKSHKKSQSFDRNNQDRWRSRHRERGSTSHTSNVAPLCDSIITDTEILPRRNDSMPDRMALAVRPESDITQSKMCTTSPIKLIDSTRKGEMVLQKGWKKTGQQHPSRAKAWAPKTKAKEGSFVCAVTEVPSIVESQKSTTVIDGESRSSDCSQWWMPNNMNN